MRDISCFLVRYKRRKKLSAERCYTIKSTSSTSHPSLII
ncbi:hypothetical protein BVRB_006480 [Beta vulgaris subsp. vulgaris]|uniref:Uncharacterized protein n=1 Tax=Beta vulgaris subsp. vulgaris TaxID=3555 RepID=A0A0J8B772_BETVV|nr:hypothetical protein BVRB_006480 [Beta vulgaris subsp. vulgaris]